VVEMIKRLPNSDNSAPASSLLRPLGTASSRSSRLWLRSLDLRQRLCDRVTGSLSVMMTTRPRFAPLQHCQTTAGVVNQRHPRQHSLRVQSLPLEVTVDTLRGAAQDPHPPQ
jgi:hypothetical protein